MQTHIRLLFEYRFFQVNFRRTNIRRCVWLGEYFSADFRREEKFGDRLSYRRQLTGPLRCKNIYTTATACMKIFALCFQYNVYMCIQPISTV